MNKYSKICIRKEVDFSIYHGKGTFRAENNKTSFHYDTNPTVTYFLSCEGNIKIEGKYYDIHSGDVVIMNPNEVHSCYIESNSYHERISIVVSKSILDKFRLSENLFFDIFEKREKGIGNIIDKKTVKKYNIGLIMESILSLSTPKTERSSVLCICKIIELMNAIEIALGEKTSGPANKRDANPRISEAVNYINSHFTEEIDCVKIADRLFISRYRLEHLFKEYIGISLWEYVILKRLMFVNELIRKDYTAEKASQVAGFKNYSNFYRLYKKHFDMSPTDYKKNL